MHAGHNLKYFSFLNRDALGSHRNENGTGILAFVAYSSRQGVRGYFSQLMYGQSPCLYTYIYYRIVHEVQKKIVKLG